MKRSNRDEKMKNVLNSLASHSLEKGKMLNVKIEECFECFGLT